MTFESIKEQAKMIVSEFYTMPVHEWSQKYFNPFGGGLNGKQIELLYCLTDLFFEYKQGRHKADDVKKYLDGYKSWFEKGEDA